MIYELQANEFFAFLTHEAVKTGERDKFVISRIEMNNRAYEIEEKCPELRICLDKYSLNTLECQLGGAITFTDKIITINLNHLSIPNFLQWSLPSNETVNKMRMCHYNKKHS